MKRIASSLRALGARVSRNIFPYFLTLLVPTASLAGEAHGSDVSWGRGANPRRRAPVDYVSAEEPAEVQTGGTVIPEPPQPQPRRRQPVDYTGTGAMETGGTLISVSDIEKFVKESFGSVSSYETLRKLRDVLAQIGFRLAPDAEEWFDAAEKKVLKLTPNNVTQETPDPKPKNQGRTKERSQEQEEEEEEEEEKETAPQRTDGDPKPERDGAREIVADKRPEEILPTPGKDPAAPPASEKPVADGGVPRATPEVDLVTGRPIVAASPTDAPGPVDTRVEPTSGKGDKFDPLEDYLQRLKKKKEQDTAIARRITDIETTTTFAPQGEDIDEEALATFADGHGTDVAELADFAPPAPKPTARVVPENTDRRPLSKPDPVDLEEKRAAAIREAEEALSDASLSADELQAKLNRLISLASAEELADGDGGDVRIITVPPPPVTVVNNFGPLPASGNGGKAQTAALVNGFLDDRNRPEAEDGAKESKRPNAEGDYAEAIPQPGGKRRRAMVLLPPKRRSVLTAAAGAPTATVKTSGGPQGAKISKSLIQGLRDAIAARRGLTRTHGSVLASVPVMARKMGEGAVSATRKLARLYAGSLVPEGPAAPLGAGVTTALSLLLLGGLLWATRRRGDTGR